MIFIRCSVCDRQVMIPPKISESELVGTAQTFAYRHKDCK